MQLSNQQRRHITSWVAAHQEDLGLRRVPMEAARLLLLAETGVPASKGQFERVVALARCQGDVRLWRGASPCWCVQKLLFPEMEAARS